LGCFNPNLGQILKNPNVGLKNVIKTCWIDSTQIWVKYAQTQMLG